MELLHHPLRLSPGYRFQWEEAQRTYVLLYPEGMIKLNPSAAAILERIDGARSGQAVIDELQAKFPDADLKADVEQFLGEAHERGWITVA